MRIQLSDHFTYKKLFRFVMPSIIMMIFTSIYGVVDGLFVSNYVGKTAFAAVNLIMPFLMGISTLGLVNALYNFQLMRFAGADGVAAYGTIMYVNFIFVATYIGYSIGSAPIIGYNYGAGNHRELKNMLRMSLTLVGIWGIALALASQLLAAPLATIFVGYDRDLFALTCHGFRIYALTFLVNGFNIFGSSFFTALNNGAVSAIISFLRTLVFQIAALLILPLILGIDGIWSAVLVSELITLILTTVFLIKKGTVYHY